VFNIVEQLFNFDYEVFLTELMHMNTKESMVFLMSLIG